MPGNTIEVRIVLKMVIIAVITGLIIPPEVIDPEAIISGIIAGRITCIVCVMVLTELMHISYTILKLVRHKPVRNIDVTTILIFETVFSPNEEDRFRSKPVIIVIRMISIPVIMLSFSS